MKRTLILTLFLCLWTLTVRGQEFSVSTNAVDYLSGGTLNLNASWGPARHWTVEAGVKYNPFTHGKGEAERFDKQRLLSAGARWWPWHIYSGWWISGSARLQEYSRTDKDSPETSEGGRFGTAFGAGYSRMLGRHFNLDLGLAFWAGYETRTTYACQHCGRTTETAGRTFILPADLIVALSFIF